MAGKLGQWSFVVGAVIALVVGVFASRLSGDTQGWLILLLVVLGLIVGLLNVTEKESTPFLVAAAALLLTGTAGDTLAVIPALGSYLSGIVKAIAVFVTPAAIVVALKSIYSLAQA